MLKIKLPDVSDVLSHGPSRMQMTLNKDFTSLTLGLTHEKIDV